MSRPYVPPGGRVLTPYLCCRNAGAAIEWYVDVFGARLTYQPYVDADGRVGHAEIDIDGAALMLSDGYPEVGVTEPSPDQLPTYSMYLHVPDVDATVALAVEGGAIVQREAEDAFHGARVATIIDPFGIRWTLAKHLHTVSDEVFDAARKGFAGGEDTIN